MSEQVCEVRDDRSGVPAISFIALWFVGIMWSALLGVATGFATAGFAAPLTSLGRSMGWDGIATNAFTIGWLVPVALMVVGVPVGALLTNRLGPMVLGARPASLRNPGELRFATALQAASPDGSTPELFVIEAPWVDVAALARRGRRTALVTTTAATGLPDTDLYVLAVMGIADVQTGARAARQRLVVQMPVLLPRAIGRAILDAERRSPQRFLFGAVAAACSSLLGLWLRPSVGGLEMLPIFVVFISALTVVALFVTSSLGRGWLAALAYLTSPTQDRDRRRTDACARSLIADPDAWREFLSSTKLASARAGEPGPPRHVRWVMAGALPRTAREAERRIAASNEVIQH